MSDFKTPTKELAELNEQELLFVDRLFENGGNLYKAAEDAGYVGAYAYKLRNRLAKAISQAAQEYLALNSLKAAAKLVDSIDSDMPNPLHLQAANAVLDRAGVIKKDFSETMQPIIKANIFILPEKKIQEVIETTFTEI